MQSGRIQPGASATEQRALLRCGLIHAVAEIDERVARQIDEILHHPRFQGLEATWRGVHDLVRVAASSPRKDVLVRILDLSWGDLARDVHRSQEASRTRLYELVYTQTLDQAGGEPFGVLIGDYEVGLGDRSGLDVLDLEVVSTLIEIGARAFCPFVCGAGPDLLGLEGDDFASLERLGNLGRKFEAPSHRAWIRLRRRRDARFLGLTVPRVLCRLPHGPDAVRVELRRCGACRAFLPKDGMERCPACGRELESHGIESEVHGFRYEEDVTRPREPGSGGGPRSRWLWGNAAFAFGAVLARAFIRSGWLGEIRGASRPKKDGDAFREGGLVPDPPIAEFGLDRQEVAWRPPTDVALDEQRERELSDLGFIPLVPCRLVPWCAFHDNAAVWDPGPDSSADDRLAGMLQYTLCVSRFGHCLKVLAREKVSSTTTARELQEVLQDWIRNYVNNSDSSSRAQKAKFPLRAAEVTIEEGAEPGVFRCVMKLMPHYELDNIAVSVTLDTVVTDETEVGS